MDNPPLVMLILRGVHNLLDEKSALAYAEARGYEGRVLEASGEASVHAYQVRAALSAIHTDHNIVALYGFSGGGYNLRHIINQMTDDERKRMKLVVVLGAPKNPWQSYIGTWELQYKSDPPSGHMAGPKALLDDWLRTV